jgi:hypothetical protein
MKKGDQWLPFFVCSPQYATARRLGEAISPQAGCVFFGGAAFMKPWAE